MKITLEIYKDESRVKAKMLEEGVFRVGRSEFCDIVLDDKSVSRSHIEIRVTESSAYMTNMSSNSVVHVNGKKLETAELLDGDSLKVGVFQITIFHGEREINESPDIPVQDGNAQPDMAMGEIDGVRELNPVSADAAEQAAPELQDPLQVGNQNNMLAPQGTQFPQKPVLDMPVEGSAALQLSAQPKDQPEGTQLNHLETQLEIKPIVAKLLFLEGPKAGEEMFIETFEVTFGRSKKADIFLDDEKLSRIHAKITRIGMGYRLIDMNSRNGTYVNGMRILEHPLNSFDEIEIGNTKIKFLIHDIMASELRRGQLAVIEGTGTSAPVLDQTKSLQLDALPRDVLLELKRSNQASAPPPRYPSDFSGEEEPLYPTPSRSRSVLVLFLLASIIIGGVYYVITGDKLADTAKNNEPSGQLKDELDKVKLPANLPKGFAELSPEEQKQVEGFYNSAINSATQGQYEDSIEYLRRIHAMLPFYKDSGELFDTYVKHLKEKQILEAQKRAKADEKQDLEIYLEDGMEYLRAGNFDQAAEAFSSAIVIDPSNETAAKGLKAAEAKVKDINAIPDEVDQEKDKREMVTKLFHEAVAAFTSKKYQEAIQTAEKIRQIELKDDSQYLNEAKQIIDRAQMLQKEEFEPFLIQAKEKYAEGDYNASRDLCEEMTKRDPAYEEAQDCAMKSKKQLNRLAKEAYTYGYILESMNRIEEAKQYWNRAKQYVRPGDSYYDKVMKKLDYYQ